MLTQLNAYLQSLDWSEDETPPVVEAALFFEGNVEEESIAPNNWGYGRPSIADLHQRFKDIAARADVERVLVGLHVDWIGDYDGSTFPPADHVHIYTTASQPMVESWIAGLHADGALKGWPNGKPRNAPQPGAGFQVYSVVWD